MTCSGNYGIIYIVDEASTNKNEGGHNMYRFSKGLAEHDKELVCIYFFGEETWRKMVDEAFDGTITHESFSNFMEPHYQKAVEALKDRIVEDREVVTILEEGEIFEMLIEADRKDVIEYVKRILNRNTMSVNDYIHDLEEMGWDKYIGLLTRDEPNGKTYLYIFNRQHDDINFNMEVTSLKASGFAAATGLCLRCEYVGRDSE